MHCEERVNTRLEGGARYLPENLVFGASAAHSGVECVVLLKGWHKPRSISYPEHKYRLGRHLVKVCASKDGGS